MKRPILAFLLLALLGLQTVRADDSVVARLRQRLTASDADAVNAYLDTEAGWKRDALPFFAQVKRCDRPALELMLDLMSTTNASASKGNSDLLELAMGRCPEVLLPLTPVMLVGQLCRLDAWAEGKAGLATTAQELAEIDRRLKRIRLSTSLRNSEQGKACVHVYSAVRAEASQAPQGK